MTVDLTAKPKSPEEPPEELFVEEGRPLLVFGLAQVMAEAELRDRAIDQLTTIVNKFSGNHSIWIMTSSDPWLLLEEAVSEGGGRRESGGILDFGDAHGWVQLLSRFSRAYARVDWRSLDGMRSDEAHSAYWSMLWCCTDSERLALLHLASEGVANPKQKRALWSLVCRGLLSNDTGSYRLRFRCERFRRFVEEHASSDHLLEWEREHGRHGWYSLRFVVGIFLVAVFCFLFFLDIHLLKDLSVLLTTLAALIPIALGLMSRLGSPGSTPGG